MMVLYKADVVPESVDDAIADLRREHGFDLPESARDLVERVLDTREQIDAELEKYLKEDWSLDRLGAVERAILRIAVCELQQDMVPTQVAIDEAVELAQRYASPEA